MTRSERAAPPRMALVVCFSHLATDPRVIRQIGWLTGSGWMVDTLGFGPSPLPSVRTHYALREHIGSRASPLVRLALHAALPHSARFRALDGFRVPPGLAATRSGAYDLVVVNDLDLLPWAEEVIPGLLAPGGRAHLDIHEYHRWEGHGASALPRRLLFAGFHRWLVRFIGSPVFSSRTTVAPGIAALYVDDFPIDPPAIVRNSPDRVDQSPQRPDPEQLRLLYHGNADLTRGLPVLVEAMKLLPERFHLTLMLTGRAEDQEHLKNLTRPLGSRVAFVPPVAMADVARAINQYDLEVIFYPPNSPNHRFSFPNKFFEAIQGRLGVVVGESPSMADVVREFGNGVIVDGWTAADLARTIDALQVEDIVRMKEAAGRAAAVINSTSEGEAFLRSAWPDHRL